MKAKAKREITSIQDDIHQPLNLKKYGIKKRRQELIKQARPDRPSISTNPKNIQNKSQDHDP